MLQDSSAASEKVRYYTEDESVLDYYSPNPEQSIGGDSVWLGALAKELGLSGPVLKDDLTAMMFGHAPDGTAIRWDKQRDDQEQRLVLDACLSPPKSWSIAALVCDEEVLIQLHNEAVAEVAKLMEGRLAAARIQVNGHRESIQTKNLAIAALTHYTARPVKELDELLKVDPQLHTHMLIMNGTQCPDGTYRALHAEMLCAAIGLDNLYKNKLAQKAVEHGFAIRNTPNGFELAAISDELIEAYSSRRTLAKALCKKQGLALTPDNIEKMTLRSRMAKKLPKTLDEMMAEWTEQGKELGLEGIPRDENAAIEEHSVREMLDSAIRHYSERSTSFTHQDIELYVFQNPQRFDEQALAREIFCHPNLIPIGDRFTTYAALNLEKQILDQWFKGQQQAEAYAPEGISLTLDLNDKQHAVVEATLQSRDRDQLWQGISGAGKTRSLGALKKELDRHGVKVRGFAPGIQESKELARELEIETNTVASLVLQEKGLGKDELWIIDEAGKLSTRQLKTIQDKAELTGSRLLLVGDKNQNAAIEAGSPFRQIQRYGATTHKLDKIIRQQDSVQKRAVELIANGQPLESLSLLCEHDYVNEIKDAALKVEQIAQDYLSLSPAERAKTLIVSGTNAEAKAITAQIRDGLREEGLIGEDLETEQIVSRQLTTEQKQQLYNYRKGDFIRLHGRNPNKILKVGELYQVTAIHENDLTLINGNGKYFRFSPKRYTNLEVYRTQDLQIAVGDRLRWTHSNRKLGRINGAMVDVVAIKNGNATLRSKTGKLSTVDLSKPVDLSHSLVSTNYRAQGQSEDRVLMSATADPTSMQEAFYVAISRQKWFLKIYTQDLDKIKTFITQSNTQKNALELINEQRRIEAERYRSAIESLGRYRHQHPFIHSAIASLAAGAIRKYVDQSLVRRELAKLYQQLEGTHRRIKQLNRRLVGQNRPTGAQRLAYIQDYQAAEAELSLFLDEFEQDIRDSFGPELEEMIDSYSFEDDVLAEAEPIVLGEYCPVDIPLPDITPESQPTQAQSISPGSEPTQSNMPISPVSDPNEISSEITIGDISIEGQNSRFDLVQVTQTEYELSIATDVEILQTKITTKPGRSEAQNLVIESTQNPEPHVILFRTDSLIDFKKIERLTIDQAANTQPVSMFDIDRSKSASAESLILDKGRSPSEVQSLSRVVQISKGSIEPTDSFGIEASETVTAQGLPIQLDHQDLPTAIEIKEKSSPPRCSTDLIDFDLAVIEAERITPLPQSEASIRSIGETEIAKAQAFTIKANSHGKRVLTPLEIETVGIEPWLQTPESRLITSPLVSFTTAIAEADELGVTQSVQIELGPNTISDVTVEVWSRDTSVVVIDSSPTIHPAASEEQLLAIRETLPNPRAIELSSWRHKEILAVTEQFIAPDLTIELSPLSWIDSQEWQRLETIVLKLDEPTLIRAHRSEVFRPSASWEIIPAAIAPENEVPISFDLKLINELEFVAMDQISAPTLDKIEAIPAVQFNFDVPGISAISIESWEVKPTVEMRPQMLITQSTIFEPLSIYINELEPISSVQVDSPTIEANSITFEIDSIQIHRQTPSLAVQKVDPQQASSPHLGQLEVAPTPVISQRTQPKSADIEHRASQIIITDSEQPAIERQNVDLTQPETLSDRIEILDRSYIQAIDFQKPCNVERDRNNKDELEIEFIQFSAPDLIFNVDDSLLKHHAFHSNQSDQRAVIDRNRKLKTSRPPVGPADSTERISDPESIDQERPLHLYGESYQQGETHSVQSFRDDHRPQDINRARHSRGVGEPQPYPRQRQLHHGQPAIPQPNHDRDGHDVDSGDESRGQDWTDALAEYRVLKEVATPLRDVVHALQQLQQAKQELRQARLLRVVPKPKLIPVFWKPKYDNRDRPQNVWQKHWEEFKKSAIHPALIKLNLSSLEGWAVQMRLLEDKLNQMSSGQFPTKPMIRLMNRYQALCEAGGWWGSAGVDPFNDWKPSRWGCFKGDRPRIIDGEIVKYEHPKGTERQFFLANIPDWLATKILLKHGIEFQNGDSFWKIVHERNLPIIYIEGYKKSLAALSQGEIAIGIPGVNALYRANEKVNGEKFRLPERELTRPAQFWATPGREIRWAFDKDPKLKSILNVQRDMVRAIELMPQCTHRVLDWNAKYKGVDDLIAQAGPRAFNRSVDRAGSANRFIKAHYRRLYNAYRKHGINDPQIWLSAAREGDIHDGDRVLAQSDTARNNPTKAQQYIKQQKAIALELMQRSQASTQTRRRGRGR